MCQPDSTPAGISVSTCTISRPGIDDADRCSTVRLSLPVSSSAGSALVAAGSDDIASSLLWGCAGPVPAGCQPAPTVPGGHPSITCLRCATARGGVVAD